MKQSRQSDENQQADLEQLVSEVELWRKHRPYPRAPFPLEILQRVHILAEQAPELKVFGRVGMNPRDVAARVKVAARGKKKTAPQRPVPIRNEFVELSVPVISREPIIITVERGEGVRFVLEIARERLAEAAALVASFIGGVA